MEKKTGCQTKTLEVSLTNKLKDMEERISGCGENRVEMET